MMNKLKKIQNFLLVILGIDLILFAVLGFYCITLVPIENIYLQILFIVTFIIIKCWILNSILNRINLSCLTYFMWIKFGFVAIIHIYSIYALIRILLIEKFNLAITILLIILLGSFIVELIVVLLVTALDREDCLLRSSNSFKTNLQPINYHMLLRNLNGQPEKLQMLFIKYN